MISVILPAHDEAATLGRCLEALMHSVPPANDMEVIVVANGCSDGTAEIAHSFTDRAFPLQVLELQQGNKLAALNAGDAAARGDMRAYLDADVLVSPELMAQIATVLSVDTPRYASGKVRIPPARSGITRAFGRFYQTVPFMQQGVPGCGLFAVNAAGRARWAEFPDIISDDTFVRLCFSPEERVPVEASYEWPLVEGFGNLVKVRLRQDRGVAEIADRFPGLLLNDDKQPYDRAQLLRNALHDPLGFATYGAVKLMVKLKHRLGKQNSDWSRGR